FLKKPTQLDGWAGSAEFDPIGISEYVDIRYLRESELKHGRICMLAAVGLIVQELVTFGGKYFPKMLPVQAHDFYLGGMSQLLLFIAAFESLSYFAIRETLEGKREPGDFGFDPLNLGKEPAAFAKFRESELKNGRLAMIAVGGMIHQQWVSGQGTLEQLFHFKP
uniref:Fucoxanthin-chlorophyll a-c binding protein, chloroplastic n=1 Tax=Porphyridium purpureum TaxID=35688 RepID=UPI0023299F98|nr:Chain 72, Fucoxanthin-chlorophyll a-c binding protein, chloroplastic [Porphyridium purpureum]7Y5E_7N Chain 7N, Fucoxanthin-chlorophyll a-c binding protein, chloroplastic [Porphyridium purpureum]7Y7A_77 Chain 77, Fucoxanthin-chlorophyll a-c binding protein, chloroplastic [Porphyridium purpureum]7Y7A_7o Chain 7o, Fucoxanthin-chlorophyll a-c binding protein, chloroplastic [Porphyridium purpureum]